MAVVLIRNVCGVSNIQRCLLGSRFWRWKTIRSDQNRKLERQRVEAVQHFGASNIDGSRLRETTGNKKGSVKLRQVTARIRDCARRRDFNEGWRIFNDHKDPDAAMFDAVLSLCARALWRERARDMWSTMPKEYRSVVTFSTMIDLAARGRRINDAEYFMREMTLAEVMPNLITYTSLVKAYGTSATHFDSACAVFKESLPGLEHASTQGQQMAYQVILAAASRHGGYEKTREFFDEMVDRGVPADRGHYHSLLAACIKTLDADTMDTVLQEMRSNGIAPDVQTYTAMVSCSREDLARCQQIRDEMREAGIAANSDFFVELLEAYVLAGDAAKANAVVQEAGGKLDTRSRKVAALLRQLQVM